MPSSKLHIVKVQVPLMTTEPEAKALIYNKSRTFEVYVPVDNVIKKMGGDFKKFFYVKFKTKGFELHGEAPWQEW